MEKEKINEGRRLIMKTVYERFFKVLLIVSMLITVGLIDGASAERMNPCSKNPCMAKNPCATKNIPIRKKPIKDAAMLKEMSERLWNDTKLGKAGLSCSTCHLNGNGLKMESFPKYIHMAGDILTMDQMINFCMTNPMKGKALAWNSQEITALAAYITANSSESAAEPVNPCGMK